MDHRKLHRLAMAFEAHGVPVLGNLRPGASDAELDALAHDLGVALPDELRTLYRWRNGHIDPNPMAGGGHMLVFRDNVFLRLEDIPAAYAAVSETYAYLQEVDVDPGVDLAACVPIAEFMGARYVVACGEQRLTARSRHPVISVFQGISVFFYSIGSMIDTCIDWVEQPDYEPFREAPNERAIWLRHNPGVF